MDQFQESVGVSAFQRNPSCNNILWFEFAFISLWCGECTACNSLDDFSVFFWGAAARPDVFFLPREIVPCIDCDRFLDKGNVDQSSARTDCFHAGVMSNLEAGAVESNMGTDTILNRRGVDYPSQSSCALSATST